MLKFMSFKSLFYYLVYYLKLFWQITNTFFLLPIQKRFSFKIFKFLIILTNENNAIQFFAFEYIP